MADKSQTSIDDFLASIDDLVKPGADKKKTDVESLLASIDQEAPLAASEDVKAKYSLLPAAEVEPVQAIPAASKAVEDIGSKIDKGNKRMLETMLLSMLTKMDEILLNWKRLYPDTEARVNKILGMIQLEIFGPDHTDSYEEMIANAKKFARKVWPCINSDIKALVNFNLKPFFRRLDSVHVDARWFMSQIGFRKRWAEIEKKEQYAQVRKVILDQISSAAWLLGSFILHDVLPEGILRIIKKKQQQLMTQKKKTPLGTSRSSMTKIGVDAISRMSEEDQRKLQTVVENPDIGPLFMMYYEKIVSNDDDEDKDKPSAVMSVQKDIFEDMSKNETKTDDEIREELLGLFSSSIDERAVMVPSEPVVAASSSASSSRRPAAAEEASAAASAAAMA